MPLFNPSCLYIHSTWLLTKDRLYGFWLSLWVCLLFNFNQLCFLSLLAHHILLLSDFNKSGLLGIVTKNIHRLMKVYMTFMLNFVFVCTKTNNAFGLSFLMHFGHVILSVGNSFIQALVDGEELVPDVAILCLAVVDCGVGH